MIPSELIKTLIEKGVSRVRIASSVNKTVPTIYSWEKERTEPKTSETAILIALLSKTNREKKVKDGQTKGD